MYPPTIFLCITKHGFTHTFTHFIFSRTPCAYAFLVSVPCGRGFIWYFFVNIIFLIYTLWLAYLFYLHKTSNTIKMKSIQVYLNATMCRVKLSFFVTCVWITRYTRRNTSAPETWILKRKKERRKKRYIFSRVRGCDELSLTYSISCGCEGTAPRPSTRVFYF